MADNWYVGNAELDGKDNRGWLIGHFMSEADGPRSTGDVEVKWGVHPAGEGRDAWQTDERRTTVLVLVSGQFRLDLSVGTFTLKRQGDYAIWGPGIDHAWTAEVDSVVLTIRWPSQAEDRSSSLR